MSLGLVICALGLRLGQGPAREAGTEKSDVSGINLSRAECSIVYAFAFGQPEKESAHDRRSRHHAYLRHRQLCCALTSVRQSPLLSRRCPRGEVLCDAHAYKGSIPVRKIE